MPAKGTISGQGIRFRFGLFDLASTDPGERLSVRGIGSIKPCKCFHCRNYLLSKILLKTIDKRVFCPRLRLLSRGSVQEDPERANQIVEWLQHLGQGNGGAVALVRYQKLKREQETDPITKVEHLDMVWHSAGWRAAGRVKYILFYVDCQSIGSGIRLKFSSDGVVNRSFRDPMCEQCAQRERAP